MLVDMHYLRSSQNGYSPERIIPMLRITINIKPVTTNTTITRTTSDDNKKRRRLWVTLTMWGGTTVATLACINDALKILNRLGII
jgi:hypothetical protein